MMKKKYLLTSLLSLLISSVGFAQSNLGVDYFGAGELNAAKNVFTEQLSSGQSPAEAYYYLGEIAYLDGNLADAKANYEKGLAASPDYTLNSVGLAKLMLKTDPKGADDAFSAAIKKNKKDVQVLLAIANAYSQNGMQAECNKKLSDARKADKNSAAVFLFEGDQFLKNKNLGKATESYAQAINIDPNSVLGHVKTAQVYENANAETAISEYQKVLELQPKYDIAYSHIGKLYWKSNDMPKAIEAYTTFFKAEHYTVDDLRLYASALYFTKKYPASITLIKESLKNHPTDFVLNRLLMYNYVDSKDDAEALPQAEKFFALDKGTSTYTAQDYTSYATALAQAGQMDKSIDEYDNAVKLDSTKYTVYKEAATRSQEEKQYELAGTLMDKYIEHAGPGRVESLDYYNQGSDYYYAGSALLKNKDAVDDVAKGTDLMKKADAAFEKVTERAKDNYLGYRWRARANAKLDPETTEGLAKPYYEQTIQIVLAKKDSATSSETKSLLEAYQYMAYYNYVKATTSNSADDKAQVSEYCNKMLELDPDNKVAPQLLDAIKPKPAAAPVAKK